MNIPATDDANNGLPVIRSLAGFKAALTVHQRWLMRFASADGRHISDWKPRAVAHLQTNAVAFARSYDPTEIELVAQRPHASGSWLSFPKAKSCSFPAPATIRIRQGDENHWLEYRAAR